jgi:hypothetical protein
LFSLHETALETLSNNADAVAEKNALNLLSHQSTTLGMASFPGPPSPHWSGGGGALFNQVDTETTLPKTMKQCCDPDPDPSFEVNPNLDPIRIQGFDDQKLKKKNTDENLFISFILKY